MLSKIKYPFLILLFGFLLPFNFIFAETAKTDFIKLFYYRDGERAWESFQKNVKSIDVIAPQSYGVRADGVLKGGLKDEFLSLVRANKVKIMPLLTNSGFSQKDVHDILDNPDIQDKIIQAMVAEGKKQNYWGWQFDFEQMTAEYRDKYSAFVKRAYPEFKKNNLVFSVAVISQTSLDPNAYPNNLWQRVIGVYDYKALGANSDFLSIMSYDQPASGGPVASLDWVKQVVRFAISQVPPAKLSLGIPFYYWKWDDSTGKLVDIGTYRRIDELFKYPKQIIKKGWNPTYQVGWVNYTQSKKTYTAWYENSQSFSRKIDLALLFKMHGFSAWALGQEDPDVHSVIATRKI